MKSSQEKNRRLRFRVFPGRSKLVLDSFYSAGYQPLVFNVPRGIFKLFMISNRCVSTGRSRSVFRCFRLSRISLRFLYKKFDCTGFRTFFW